MISYVDSNSSKYPYKGVQLGCRCGKLKVWTFRTYRYDKKELDKIISLKGWTRYAEVQNTY